MKDVVTLLTPVGEIIGRIKDESETEVILESPRTFVQTEQGMGFAPGICMTGEQNPREAAINKSLIVAIVKSNSEVEKSWQQQTSGIVLS